MARMSDDDAAMSFGDLLRLRRGDMPQRRLVRLLEDMGHEITDASISGWERGRSLPTRPALVAAIEELLGCPGELTGALGWSEQSTPDRLAGIETRLASLERELRDLLNEIRSGS